MLLFKNTYRFCMTVFLIGMVSACGFQPLYKTNDTATSLSVQKNFSDIQIANIPNRDGQYLKNQLIDRLYINGTPTNAKYRLEINNLEKDIVNMGLRKDATYTRGEMRIRADVILVDTYTNKTVLKRKVRTIGGFNLLDNQFATLISEESLTDHLLEELSDDIVNDVRLYFAPKDGGS